MTDADSRMRAWCERASASPTVKAWLTKNPPPGEWSGTEWEWAYTEMPVTYYALVCGVLGVLSPTLKRMADDLRGLAPRVKP